ncbi:MAG: ABC transporter permease [Chloroflexi bacterium]|nr:ABC transporter permease [Chloroflexota bacterium]
MNGIVTIAHLTLHEARGRKVMLAALILGLAFLVVFAIGFYLIYIDVAAYSKLLPRIQQNTGLSFVVMAGLYAVNFLMVMTAVLMPVDTLSGDIHSGAIQTLATKPLRREEIVLGKWVGFWLILVMYLTLMAGGVLLIVRIIAGYTMPNAGIGLGLILLEATLLMTLSILGGTRLNTLANGVTVLGMYGLAFIGGWMEQIGTLFGNATAQNVGVIASLIVPTESLWQLAAYHMQPPLIRDIAITPFMVASVPSTGMVVWAVAYVVIALLVALRLFKTRDL